MRDGDCLSSLAARFGFRHWRSIYDAPENAELRASRPNPNLLAAGDVVTIPDHEPRVEDAVTGRRHVFRARRADARVRIILEDPDGTPRPGLAYVLRAGGTEQSGVTTDAGLVDCPIPRDATHGTLEIEGESWDLLLGALPPSSADGSTPALRRLVNLGYDVGAPGEARTEMALERFKQDAGLPPDASFGDAAREARKRHGC